jgi:hypothetical protein
MCSAHKTYVSTLALGCDDLVTAFGLCAYHSSYSSGLAQKQSGTMC